MNGLTLFCDRCGAEFVTTELVRECPHCAPIGGVQ